MTCKLDGVYFNVTLAKEENKVQYLSVYTETPCCVDLSYSTYIDDKEAEELVAALANKTVSLRYTDAHHALELSYNGKTVYLELDELSNELEDTVLQLQNYYEMVRELEHLRLENAELKEKLVKPSA